MDSIQHKVHLLKEQINDQLDFCNMVDTPYLCSTIGIPENKIKIVDRIVEIIAQQGITISGAILLIEQELNPNFTLN